MKVLRRWRLLLITILAVAAFVGTSAFRSRSTSASNIPEGAPQDLTSLERRISLLEQRFYGVENSITRLEQQSRLSGAAQMPSNDPTLEINLLRSQIEALQRRLTEIECGLTRLDERTLTPAAREARRRSTGALGTDPCRLNPDAPLKLSTRP